MKIDDVLTLLGLIFAIFAIYYVIVCALRNDGGCCDGTDCDTIRLVILRSSIAITLLLPLRIGGSVLRTTPTAPPSAV